MKAILYIIAPLPVIIIITWALSALTFVLPEDFPHFIWVLIVSIGLVASFYSIYKFWRMAIEETIKEMRK